MDPDNYGLRNVDILNTLCLNGNLESPKGCGGPSLAKFGKVAEKDETALFDALKKRFAHVRTSVLHHNDREKQLALNNSERYLWDGSCNHWRTLLSRSRRRADPSWRCCPVPIETHGGHVTELSPTPSESTQEPIQNDSVENGRDTIGSTLKAAAGGDDGVDGRGYSVARGVTRREDGAAGGDCITVATLGGGSSDDAGLECNSDNWPLQCCNQSWTTLRRFLTHRQRDHREQIREVPKNQCAYLGCGDDYRNLTVHERAQHYTCACGHVSTGRSPHGQTCQLTSIDPFEDFRATNPPEVSLVVPETAEKRVCSLRRVAALTRLSPHRHHDDIGEVLPREHHTQEHCDRVNDRSSTPGKRKRGTSTVLRSGSKHKRRHYNDQGTSASCRAHFDGGMSKHRVEIADGLVGESCVGLPSETTSTAGESSSTLIPSEGSPDAVPTRPLWPCVPSSIEWLNRNKLGDKARLNDEIINCYLLNLLGSRPSKKRIFMFNSFFYGKIKGIKTHNNIFEAAKRWTSKTHLTSKTDLLSHDYILVPVYQPQSEHWWMAIICNPGQLNGPQGDTINVHEPFRIITLDSLGDVDHSDVAADLTAYLGEYKKAQTSLDVSTPSEPGLPAKRIPMQQNAVDCGVFMLHFSEEFLRDPDEFVRRITKEDSELWPFDPVEWRKRAQIEISHHLETAVRDGALEAEFKAKMEGITSQMADLSGETGEALYAIAVNHREEFQALVIEHNELREELSRRLPDVADRCSWAKRCLPVTVESFIKGELTISICPSNLPWRKDTSHATRTKRRHPSTTAQPPSETAPPTHQDTISISSDTKSEKSADTPGPASEAAAAPRRSARHRPGGGRRVSGNTTLR